MEAIGTSYEAISEASHRPIYDRLEAAPATNRRPVVVADEIDVRTASLRALGLLKEAPEGYLLVIEWDAHTDDARQGLQNVADFDRLIRDIQSRVDLDDTLLVFTADHSFGLQVDSGQRGEDVMKGYDAWKASGGDDDVVRLDHMLINRSHTAEEVRVLAIGAGS